MESNNTGNSFLLGGSLAHEEERRMESRRVRAEYAMDTKKLIEQLSNNTDSNADISNVDLSGMKGSYFMGGYYPHLTN